MADFRMPALGADMTEGTLLEWLVHPGDQVHRGDIIAVVDTDKAAIEVECFADGVVDDLLVAPGTRVPVGAVLAHLRDDGAGAVKEPVAEKEPVASVPLPPSVAGPPVASPIVRHLAHERGIDLTSVRGSGPDGVITRADVLDALRPNGDGAPTPSPTPTSRPPQRARVSPYARRRASELGIDLADVAGSGPEGVVTASDVEMAGGERRPEQIEVPPQPTAPQPKGDDAHRAAAMRRAIGDLMSHSKREIPHYYLSTTVDMTAATDWLRDTNATRPVTDRMVPAALLLRATALAARKVPSLNGWWVDDGFQPCAHVHLGVAVSLRPAGLVAPAILEAERLDLDALMAALQDLVTRARAGRLRSREMSAGTLTVTNLGDNGAESVYGVIYPPQVALVGVGRVIEAPVARHGLVGARPVVNVTLSADHRATDAHEGSRFLAVLDALLQKPEKL